MRDFQEFIDKNIAVTFADKKELRVFLDICKENNLTWGMNAPATEPFLKENGRWLGKILEKSIRYERVLLYSEPEYYKRRYHEIVPAAEFLTKAPTIEIFQSKQTVVCLKKQDGKVVAVGKARCNPEDEFDFEYGAYLAFTRMLDIGKFRERINKTDGIKTLKNGMRIKKQDKYEVGDRVLIKKKPDRSYGKEHYGKTATIIEIKPNISGNKSYVLDIDTRYLWIDKDIKGKVM